MKKAGAVIAALFLAACGQVPVGQTSTNPSPTASGPPVIAILQAIDTSNPLTYNTVVIAGLNGAIRAKATFAPAGVPQLGCVGAILPVSAHVAAGKVFFADANGVVRTLAADGTTSTVATFPVTSSQQMMSFAVSPDGGRVLATVFTAPKNAFPCDGTTLAGTYTLDAYAAATGQASRLVYHDSWDTAPTVMAFTGWDALGPIGTYPTVWASQGGGPASGLGVRVRIDPSTLRVLAPLDSSSCLVWDSVSSGAFVCTKEPVSSPDAVASPVSVRGSSGLEAWGFTVNDLNAASAPYLAPDEQHVAVCCSTSPAAEFLFGRDGHQSLLPNQFFASGWLDSTTVYGWSQQTTGNPQGVVSYVALAAPQTVVTLGLTGIGIGPVRG